MRVSKVVCIVLLVTGGCGRQIVEEPPRTVMQARVQPCTDWCEAQRGPCGLSTPDGDTLEECIEECSVVDGELSIFWAYQPDTQEDACFEEFAADLACITESYRQCIPRRPPPCNAETRAMSICYSANRQDEG